MQNQFNLKKMIIYVMLIFCIFNVTLMNVRSHEANENYSIHDRISLFFTNHEIKSKSYKYLLLKGIIANESHYILWINNTKIVIKNLDINVNYSINGIIFCVVAVDNDCVDVIMHSTHDEKKYRTTIKMNSKYYVS